MTLEPPRRVWITGTVRERGLPRGPGVEEDVEDEEKQPKKIDSNL